MPSHRCSRLLSFAGLHIKEALQQAAAHKPLRLALLQLTPIQIWNADLDRFLEEWEAYTVRMFFAPRDRK